MRTKRRFLVGFILAFLVLTLTLSLTLTLFVSQGFSAIPQKINYQGYLTNASGVPINGTVQVVFSIYNISSGGSPLWTETHSVTVSQGVYSVILGEGSTPNPINLPFDTTYYLGVQVGADPEMAPRKILTSVGYAFRALTVESIGSHSHSGADITTGTVLEPRIDSLIARDSEVSSAIGTHAAIVSAHHTRYTDGEAVAAIKAADGSGSGLDADLLDGQHASGFASSAHDHDATYVNVTGDTMSGMLAVSIPSGGSHGISSITSSTALGAAGVEAKNFGAGNGLNAYSASKNAVIAQSGSTDGYGGYFYNGSGSGTDRGVSVGGFSGTGSSADTHPSGNWYKAGGEFAGPNGVIGAASSDSGGGVGVVGLARSGDNSYGIYGYKSGGGNYAGYFLGNVHVTGNLSATGTKPFKIDHPLDPANKYLMHYAIESPAVQNMYNGTIVLDAYGEAIVQLPDYFEALNSEEFTYTLTPIGASMPNLYVAEEVQNSQFKISGGVGGKKVSWVLISQRNDPWVKNNPAKDVVDKPKEEAGTYLYPEGHGQPESLSLTSVRMQKQTKP